MLAACSTASVTPPRLVAQTSSRPTRSAAATDTRHSKPPKPTASKSSPPKRSRPTAYRNIPVADFPRHVLTPGVALSVTRAQICISGYASRARDVSDAEKADVYARYRIVWVPYVHEVDHLISLELGGSNAIRNLWPEPYAGRWGARTKDVLENRLHQLVCDGQLALASAQRQEAQDWVAAYRRYVGSLPATGGSGGSSSGGFYASSYSTASTIYCADDPTWHELSKKYLVHFDTFAQAKARFPGYHLHRQC
jgi:hypothetical protein